MRLTGLMLLAGLWGLDNLDDPQTAEVLQQAEEQPDVFVLKPQREGGGNNLYGADAQQKLRTRKGLSAYILMQRIRPPINRYSFWGTDIVLYKVEQVFLLDEPLVLMLMAPSKFDRINAINSEEQMHGVSTQGGYSIFRASYTHQEHMHRHV